jgi:hypothetical protein
VVVAESDLLAFIVSPLLLQVPNQLGAEAIDMWQRRDFESDDGFSSKYLLAA